MATRLELGNYYLDILDVKDFKSYLEENESSFSATAYKAFLKTVDIPPKFFKEQPIETQKELIENRDTFVRETKKYFDKVIVVVRLKLDLTILNACRMTISEAKSRYEQLKTIDQVTNKFEHRSFMKDGYISYIITKDNDIKKDKDNLVLALDFPIMLNKKAIVHKAHYTLPNETFATPIEHIHYLTSDEIDFEMEFPDIKAAVESFVTYFLNEEDEVSPEPKNILREPEVVALALAQTGTIPNSYVEKIGTYISTNLKGVLTTKTLESLVLDYDETFRSYKQVTNLRSVSGYETLKVLESEDFKQVVDEMEELLNKEPEIIKL